MTENEAVELLKHHSGTHQDISHSKSEKGFLGTLRPFEGALHEENFHEVIAILKVLAPKLRNQTISREIISNLWSICHLAKMWALEEDSMLRRNKLITDEQRELLSTWIDCISYAVMMLLDEQEDVLAFEYYLDYLNKKG